MKWIEYLIGFARHAALKSKDTTKVGAVAVGKSKNILETGFNGIPRGVVDLPERMERPQKYLWTGHAEENLVAHAARSRLEGSTVFVTHICCARCARMLINAGVARVVYGTSAFAQGSAIVDEISVAKQMFLEAGVVCERADEAV